MERAKPASEARKRILETADRLFYQDGIRAVGIDRIIAEAGVAKMTLYAHFPSKDDLIVAVLMHRENTLLAFFREAMARHAGSTRDALEAFFAALKELFAAPGFRGCAFQNAAAELADPAHPGFVFARGQKQRFAEMLRGFVAEAVGAAKADALAPAVTLVVEGAIVNAVVHRSAAFADTAREAVARLIGR
ncbi:MAG: TetR/AcrR family transcriptional regulator [Gemmataceae bacterium]|nr:TetR/AcrR family transcriptional regulator [Gemmataceae bacterium]